MGDITPNFSYYEFRPKGAPSSWYPESDYRKFLIDMLATNMQVVRNHVPSGGIKITSGVRTLSDYDRLVSQGYKPSKTSDHYCGTAVPLKTSDKKYSKYGETYNFAVGAADGVPTKISARKLFEIAYRLVKEEMCKFGQVIYEENPKNGSEWVHFGNSLDYVFNFDIIKKIGRVQFMQSLDGGRTYTVVNSI